jgi:competence protein ComEC
MPYQPLVVVLAAVCAGIVADRQANVPMTVWLVGGFAALGVWFVLWSRRYDRLAVVAVLTGVAAVGGCWHHCYWHFFRADEIGRYAHESPTPVCVEGIATAAPRRIPPPRFDPLRPPEPNDQSRLVIRAAGIRVGEEWKSASGNALVLVQGDLLGIHAGDRIQVVGRIVAAPRAGNPGEDDLAELARGRRQMAAIRAIYPQCVTVIAPAVGLSLSGVVDELRSRGDQLLWKFLPPERAELAEAVLLGNREELDSRRVEAFVETGTIHIVVVAGLHVGILAYVLFKALRTGLVPRGWALVAVVAVTFLYALVTNAEPPVLRATAVVWIVCGSMWLGRGGLGLNSLALAGLLVLAINPTELFRAGTQLSFLSVAGIIAFEPFWNRRRVLDPLERLIAETRPWPVRMLHRLEHKLWTVALLGLTIWLVVLPLVMARFHLVTPVALLVNPLLMIPVMLTMTSGFGLLLFGWLLPPLGALFGHVCNWSLGLLEWSISMTARVPAGHFWVPGPREWWLIVFYLGLALIAYAGRRAVAVRWRWAALAAWSAIGFGAAWLGTHRSGQLDCTFVAVGHGCGVVVELPGGCVLVSDAGRLGQPQLGAKEISNYLWSRGLTHIDAIVISHNDTDHFNAVPALVERFSVGAVYVSPVMFNRDTGALRALKEAIAAAGVPLRETSFGDRLLTGDESTVRVLHPPPQGMGLTENADSVVLDIELAGRRILLTGDLAPPGLEAVTLIPSTPFDAIMIPHHGSATSNPTQFAVWSKARWAIISGDLAHDSRIAVAAYQKAGSIVLNTATAGAVHLAVAPDGGLQVDCFRQGDRW